MASLEKPPRYRTGDAALDASVLELVNTAGGDDPDLIFELVASALRLARDAAGRGDLKIANAALKEMRYAFHVFAPYRSDRKVAIFGSARTKPDDPLYDLARRFATAVAAHDWMVITGAGPGIMSAGIEGAGPENSFGVSIRLPFEATTSQFIADDPKLINFRYFFTRKLAFVKESHGFALLPGGFGTLDELFELLTLVQTGKANPVPIVALDVPGATFWERWRDFLAGSVEREGYTSSGDLDLVKTTDDVAEAVDYIVGFYRNYHSSRFVDGRLVLRMQHAPTDAELAALNADFADIVVRDEIEPIATTAPELVDGDHVDLARLAFRFDRHGWARLHALIDRLNTLPSLD
ncbi:MAG: TIGR00730 family Rossman fold protein [Acidimicrobiia bacterium]